MTATVVAASSGYLSSILAGEGSAVAVGDAVALVAPSKPAHALAVEDAEGDFRVASRRVLVSDTRSNQGGEE